MVYDYFFDKEKNIWVNWMSGIQNSVTVPDEPLDFHEIIVPNIESVR